MLINYFISTKNNKILELFKIKQKNLALSLYKLIKKHNLIIQLNEVFKSQVCPLNMVCNAKVMITTKKLTLLRSPHVNKKSQEHFINSKYSKGFSFTDEVKSFKNRRYIKCQTRFISIDFLKGTKNYSQTINKKSQLYYSL